MVNNRQQLQNLSRLRDWHLTTAHERPGGGGVKTIKKATAFRKWATSTLKQCIITGFTIDRKRIEHNNTQFLRALKEYYSRSLSLMSVQAIWQRQYLL